MNRRGFLGAILAAAAAPAIIRSESLMRLAIPKPPRLWADGVHDDAEWINWKIQRDGVLFLPTGFYAVGSTIVLGAGQQLHTNGSTFRTKEQFRGDHVIDFKRGASGSALENCSIICATSMPVSALHFNLA